MIEPVIGIIIGGVIIIIVAFLYLRKTTRLLNSEIKRLEELVTDLRRNEKGAEFRRDFNDILKDIMIFWRGLRSAYASHCKKVPHLPPSLEEFIDSVPPPEGLPVSNGKNLMQWAQQVPPKWSGQIQNLWDFVTQVYPSSLSDGAVTPKTQLIDESTYDELHEARKKIANFWNRLGKAALETKDVSQEDLAELLSVHRRLVKILSYLEGALVLRTLDKGPGRQYMFQLAHYSKH
jgi:hypothetical protein